MNIEIKNKTGLVVLLIIVIIGICLLLYFQRSNATPKYIIKSGGSNFFVLSSEGSYYYITNIGTKIKAPDDSTINSDKYTIDYSDSNVNEIMYNESSKLDHNSDEYKDLSIKINNIRKLLDKKYDVENNEPKKYDFYTLYISKGKVYASIVDYTKRVHKKVGDGKVSANPQVIYEFDGTKLIEIYVSDFDGISKFGVL